MTTDSTRKALEASDKPLVYAIINSSWGEADWIIPLLFYLRTRGFLVVVIFMHYHVYRLRHSTSKGTYELLEQCCDEIHHPGTFLWKMPLRDRILHIRGALRKSERDGKSGLRRLGHSDRIRSRVATIQGQVGGCWRMARVHHGSWRLE